MTELKKSKFKQAKVKNASYAWDHSNYPMDSDEQKHFPWPEDEFIYPIIDLENSYKLSPEEDNDYQACPAFHDKHYHYYGYLFYDNGIRCKFLQIDVCAECIVGWLEC